MWVWPRLRRRSPHRPEILKTTIETYRKLRNTSAGCSAASRIPRGGPRRARKNARAGAADAAPAAELDELVRKAYADFDYKRISQRSVIS